MRREPHSGIKFAPSREQCCGASPSLGHEHAWDCPATPGAGDRSVQVYKSGAVKIGGDLVDELLELMTQMRHLRSVPVMDEIARRIQKELGQG